MTRTKGREQKNENKRTRTKAMREQWNTCTSECDDISRKEFQKNGTPAGEWNDENKRTRTKEREQKDENKRTRTKGLQQKQCENNGTPARRMTCIPRLLLCCATLVQVSMTTRYIWQLNTHNNHSNPHSHRNTSISIILRCPSREVTLANRSAKPTTNSSSSTMKIQFSTRLYQHSTTSRMFTSGSITTTCPQSLESAWPPSIGGVL